MAFEWYHPRIPAKVKAAGAERRVKMYLEEARYRAALLRRLGFSRDAALARIQRALNWGFELHERPDFLDQVPGVVDTVFRR